MRERYGRKGMDNHSGNRNKGIELVVGLVSVVIVLGFILFVLLPTLRSGDKEGQAVGTGTKYQFVQQSSPETDDGQQTDSGVVLQENNGSGESIGETGDEGQDHIPSLADDFLFADSDSRDLTDAELSYLSDEELRIARNEIYARRGRLFDDEGLRNYFGSKSWYHGTISAGSFSDDMLNDYERRNTRKIRDLEELRKNGQAVQVQRPSGSGAADSGEDSDYRSHTYQVIAANCTWTEADAMARNSGGYLVNFDSAEEYQYVLDHVIGNAYPKMKLWIGGKRDGNSDEYHWIDQDGQKKDRILNEDTEYAGFWMVGEPSFHDESVNQDEMYMNMFFYTKEDRWVWNDVPNDIISIVPQYRDTVGYLVEYQ